uniref:Thioredoxin domain-containing protein n=1 Tax=Helicotheca tamesis TaxID=374047 RepID=A0A7S2HXD6_9STRA|mmetsp:Transcript_367/g.436  ORF Transcript_367/g.436 Transcript_367/m.436 type:complete len:110 (+) Transcript_367:1-330(+)
MFPKKSGAVMYGAYWCPHCSHQKEVLGREAWSLISYSECSPKGFNSNAAVCIAKEKVDGFPTWKLKNGKKVRSGEMTLVELAKWSGYKGKIDESLENDVPMSGMSGSCR